MPVLLGAVLGTSPPAYAEELGARSAGRGEVGIADGGNTAAAPWNTAAVSLDERYDVVTAGGLGADQVVSLRAAAVDTRTASITLGLAYTRLTDNATPLPGDLPGWRTEGAELDDPTRHESVELGLAYPFFERTLSIALHPRYDWRNSELTGKTSAFNFGASLAARPLPSLTFAAGTYALLETGYRDTERTLVIGGRWQPGDFFGVEGDALAPLEDDFSWKRARWRLGADVGLLEWLRLRAGYASEQSQPFASAGLGLTSEQADLDYGVRVQVDDPNRNWHELQVTVHF